MPDLPINRLRTRTRLAVGAILGLIALASWPASGPANPAPFASRWIVGNHTRARLVAAPVLSNDARLRVYAGVHMILDDGWKTYWRTPGEAGGIPPSFDWSKSVNLASATVLYPVPRRLPGPYGETVGYKHEVLFPVHLTPRDPAKPIELRLVIYYGVCLDICIPAEGEARLLVEPSNRTSNPAAPLLLRFLGRVPGYGSNRPKIERMVAKLDGADPHLLIDARFDGPGTRADLFLEAPDGIFIPAPRRTELARKGHFRFRVDLTRTEDPALFKGRKLRLTLASDGGQSEADWLVD